MDVFTPEQRSAVMARIRVKKYQTRDDCETYGPRARVPLPVHRADLPGTPDLVFPRLKKIIFVHGCFWHQHDRCQYAYKPKSNSLFWKRKFAKNTTRDERAMTELRALGWDVLVVWECQMAETAKLLRELRGSYRNDAVISRLGRCDCPEPISHCFYTAESALQFLGDISCSNDDNRMPIVNYFFVGLPVQIRSRNQDAKLAMTKSG